MSNFDEFEIIQKYFKPLSTQSAAAQNLADDVAQISLKKDETLVISKDMMVEDVHFLASDGAYNIAAKLLLTNLSDLAASGAKPLYYMLGFSKSKNLDEEFLQNFTQGLKDVQKKYNLHLIGGDTVKTSDKLFFSLTIFGVVKKNTALLRKNAKNNDLIFVSGNIGDAYLGRVGKNKKFLERHLLPTPRIELGQKLIAQKLSKCAIDISDGLLADLQHLCDESNLSATLFANKIPVSDKNINLLDLISAGDDYELIFSAKKKDEEKILQLAKKLNIKLTCIGFFSANKNKTITLLDKEDKKINFSNYGYRH